MTSGFSWIVFLRIILLCHYELSLTNLRRYSHLKVHRQNDHRTGVILIGSKFTADVNDKGWWSHLATDLHWSRWNRLLVFHQCQRRPRLICWFAAWVDDTGAPDSDNNISLRNNICDNDRENHLRIFLKKCFEKCTKINWCWLFLKLFTKGTICQQHGNTKMYEKFTKINWCRLFLKLITKGTICQQHGNTKGSY